MTVNKTYKNFNANHSLWAVDILKFGVILFAFSLLFPFLRPNTFPDYQSLVIPGLIILLWIALIYIARPLIGDLQLDYENKKIIIKYKRMWTGWKTKEIDFSSLQFKFKKNISRASKSYILTILNKDKKFITIEDNKYGLTLESLNLLKMDLENIKTGYNSTFKQ